MAGEKSVDLRLSFFGLKRADAVDKSTTGGHPARGAVQQLGLRNCE